MWQTFERVSIVGSRENGVTSEYKIFRLLLKPETQRLTQAIIGVRYIMHLTSYSCCVSLDRNTDVPEEGQLRANQGIHLLRSA